MKLVFTLLCLVFMVTEVKANYLLPPPPPNMYYEQPSMPAYGYEVPVPVSSIYDLSNTASSNNTNVVYQVCGNETKVTDCTCKNETMECKPSQKTDIFYWYDVKNPPFASMNIQILNESFVPKIVVFEGNRIKKLQKDKILPGYESMVESLILTGNEIQEIENGAFDKFTSLQSLDLQYNLLTNVSAEILTKQLGSTLKMLKIGANHFASLSSIDFSNMIKLEELEISRQGYIGLHGNISKYIFPKSLSNLKTLDFSYCTLQTMNDEIFVNLKNLESLNLNGNPLAAFPKSFNALANLQHLYMKHSHISSINTTEFQAFTKLETFDMTYSMLRRIDDCTFCNKQNLKSVMLYGNPRLSYIDENAFGNAYNQSMSPLLLESFSVEACNLSIIPEHLLNWHMVKEFGLGKNPFICNCSMAWLINDILAPTHTMNLKSFLPLEHMMYSYVRREENAFQCHGPYALKNIPFSHISQKLSCPLKEVTYVKEMSGTTVFLIIVACAASMALGIFVAPFVRRPSKTIHQEEAATKSVGFINQNFPDADFDEIKISY